MMDRRQARITLKALTLGALAMALTSCQDEKPRFGDGTLRFRGGAGDQVSECILPEGTDPNACPDWETVVFPIMDSAPYNCTLEGSCHGSGADGLTMPPGDAAASYANMAAYNGPGDRPYISSQNPQDAYLMCNLNWGQPADSQLGAPMPIGAPLEVDEALLTVADWVACGMQGEGNPVGVGGGGEGGEGGQGGAGGVGGAGGGI